MQKFLIFFSLFLSLFTASCTNILAIYDPATTPNNSFGIHIFSEKDLEDAANLLNSKSGDWGYVTFVITEGERDRDRWQKVFDQMRRLHLIPIVRLASKPKGDVWEIPKEEEITNWIAFLNSLNWVVKNRYVIISNEPNHAKEWGGTLAPGDYATYLKSFAGKLHEASEDFYVLPAGLDFSASNAPGTMEATKYLKEMLKKEPELFNSIDAWNSHSYPNPDFSGKETDRGRGTIAGFNWELNYLKSLGIDKDLQVFITETGWSNKNLTEEEIASKFKFAYENVWNDKKVIAVTPFILSYTEPPFSQFSWHKKDGGFYKYYEEVKNLPKTQGQPIQIEKGEVLANLAQPIILSGSDFVGVVLAKNTGQSIWSADKVMLSTDSNNILLKSYSFNDLEPNKLGLIIFKAAAPEVTGVYSESLFLKNLKGENITQGVSFEALLVKVNAEAISNFFGNITKYFTSFF